MFLPGDAQLLKFIRADLGYLHNYSSLSVPTWGICTITQVYPCRPGVFAELLKFIRADLGYLQNYSSLSVPTWGICRITQVYPCRPAVFAELLE